MQDFMAEFCRESGFKKRKGIKEKKQKKINKETCLAMPIYYIAMPINYIRGVAWRGRQGRFKEQSLRVISGHGPVMVMLVTAKKQKNAVF